MPGEHRARHPPGETPRPSPIAKPCEVMPCFCLFWHGPYGEIEGGGGIEAVDGEKVVKGNAEVSGGSGVGCAWKRSNGCFVACRGEAVVP